MGLSSYDPFLKFPNPEIIIPTINKILQAFENVIQMELIRVRWEEIKRLQLAPTSA